ncbi:MAG: TIGR03905 family TSCPD domain-containing protein [Deltaproteobacteria bacterium]|nr:TIGR03905 family TSCPD domain-containing protein [Deltaproteobacteria bacterium]
MEYASETKGICPKSLRFELNDGIVSGVQFEGGCPGNLAGIGLLVEGRSGVEVAKTLKGIKCGQKKSSCPAELAKAILKAVKEEKKSVKELKTVKPKPKSKLAKSAAKSKPVKSKPAKAESPKANKSHSQAKVSSKAKAKGVAS